jgi:hypothetical protein
MQKFLRNEKEIEQELILETDSEEAILSDSDTGPDEDSANVGCDSNANGSQVCLVKTTTPLEFWWCPLFHWRSQWTENTRDALCEQAFYTYY